MGCVDFYSAFWRVAGLHRDTIRLLRVQSTVHSLCHPHLSGRDVAIIASLADRRNGMGEGGSYNDSKIVRLSFLGLFHDLYTQ